MSTVFRQNYTVCWPRISPNSLLLCFLSSIFTHFFSTPKIGSLSLTYQTTFILTANVILVRAVANRIRPNAERIEEPPEQETAPRIAMMSGDSLIFTLCVGFHMLVNASMLVKALSYHGNVPHTQSSPKNCSGPSTEQSRARYRHGAQVSARLTEVGAALGLLASWNGSPPDASYSRWGECQEWAITTQWVSSKTK